MIKKFKAPTMAEAMKLAKNYFGDDAIVLQSRKIKDEGRSHAFDDELVEITVTSEKTLVHTNSGKTTAKPFYTPADARRSTVASSGKAPPRKRKAPPDKAQANKAPSALLAMKRELAELRASIETLQQDVRKSDSRLLPDTFRFLKKDKGVESDVASELVQNIFLQLEGTDVRDDDKIKEVMQSEIKRSLNVRDALAIESGKPKVVCLVGPTGMGKTTSIIKLATHPEFYGRKRVGLVTIDTYRVAAAAQLKTFAALARIPLEIVYEPSDFTDALARLSDREVVLIDTAGRSPLNEKHLDDLKQFFRAAMPDEIHLVLSVSMRSDNLVDAATNFSKLPVNHLIVSKIDETPRLGNILNVGRRIDLPISFLTNGQKVPDDIQRADRHQMANLIIN